MADKGYSNKDLERILKKALEIQARESGRSSDGVDLEEIVSVGKDLGLPRDLVVRAAQELETTPRGASKLFGGEFEHRRTAVIPGTVDQEDLVDLGMLVQHETGVSGNLSVANRQLYWKSDAMAMAQYSWDLEVAVRTGKNGTTAEVRNRQGLLAGGLFGGIVGGIGGGVGFGVGFGVGIGVLGSPLFVVAMVLGALGGSYALSRAIFSGIDRSRRRRVTRLVEKIRGFLVERSSSEDEPTKA